MPSDILDIENVIFCIGLTNNSTGFSMEFKSEIQSGQNLTSSCSFLNQLFSDLDE